MNVARRVLPDAPARRGWCPSLARPMPTGDGLLARIHPPLGILTPAQARAVAEGARRFGNGHIDVTARANLQIRGVTELTRAPLAALLDGASLGDVRADGGPQRLTLTSPLAGPEVLALARAIEAVGLGIRRLPAKALVTIERAPLPRPVVAPGPGSPCADAPGVRERVGGLSATDADIRLLIIDEDTTPCPGRATGTIDPCSLALALAGPDGPEWFVSMTPREAIAAIEAALQTLAASGARRLRDLPPALRTGLLNRLGPAALPPRPDASASLIPGLTELADGSTSILVDAPFGRCGADALDRLADHAEALASDLHLSPSRGFVLVTANLGGARHAGDALSRLGFITRADDPRSAVAACPGAPACASGSTATLADAARLAEAFQPFAARGLRAHVSGCSKGCAHPAAADLTLVGNDGLYGIVLGGPPSPMPAMRLTFEAALERLRRADPSQALAPAFRIQP
ncbi:hypothetical protein [uncultured Methylobacterium sp.]|uniref:hypothetical protein n=1 Tax=uncultured Methylobacterium sp. TaxID=157278 RepID=UPI0035CC593C